MVTERPSGDIPRMLVDVDDRSPATLVAFTDRNGGGSKAPFDSLNLAASVGDDPSAVQDNRSRVAAALGFDADQLVLARQVHGCGVIEAGPADRGVVGEADVLVARHPGRMIGILTADCVPVVLGGDTGVAIAHAGWRGLVAGAIEAAAARVGPVSTAWIGPSIHACCYEVGPDVVDAFRSRDLPVTDDRHVDPGQAAAAICHRLDIPVIEATADCTSCDPRYFSYRRDGVTGRQGAFAALLDR